MSNPRRDTANAQICEIIRLCLSIDAVARDVYARLANLAPDELLRGFWRGMAQEEGTHVDFWRQLESMASEGKLPQVFDEPETVIAELREIQPRAVELLQQCEDRHTIDEAFLLAYRMEFYLLHPALSTLFNLTSIKPNPEDQYDNHLDQFMQALAHCNCATPELELIAEALHRLWRENRELSHQATRDSLTGLFNRRGFHSLASQMAHMAQRNGFSIGILMLDLDHFKQVNDQHGHAVGDEVLQDVANLLASSFRASDLVGRYGGEEFIVLLPSVTPQSIVQVAEKTRALVASAQPAGLPVTVSIGAAVGLLSHEAEAETQALIQRADMALYAAKEGGRNQVVASG